MSRSAEVDAYIAGKPDWARPLLTRIRNAFHAGCPQLEERLKWGVPSFEHHGMLGGMAAFKAHVTFGFWKERLLEDPEGLFAGKPTASPMGARLSRPSDLPSRRVLVDYVRRAAQLNEQDAKLPRRAPKPASSRITVPADLKAALARTPRAAKVFKAFPPGARRDYVEWITQAVRPATRAARLKTTLEWLAEGKRRNWKYEQRR